MAEPIKGKPLIELREASIRASSVSDQAVNKDSLGFEPYVMAIAEFLTNPETQPPLTLSVEGTWGSGKSSFMQQLQHAIKKRTREQTRDTLRKKHEQCIENIQKPGGDLRKSVEDAVEKLIQELSSLTKAKNLFSRQFLTHLLRLCILVGSSIVLFPVLYFLVLIYIAINRCKIIWLKFRIRFPYQPKIVWFNAWRHEKAEALWAAFALTFLDEISRKRYRLDFFYPLVGHLRLFWFRFEKNVSSLLDLFRTLAQILLFISAIALVFIFTFLKGFNWVDQLGAGVNNAAENLGRVETECIEASFGSEASTILFREGGPISQYGSPIAPQITCPAKTNLAETPPGESESDLFRLQQWLLRGGFLGTGGLATLWLWQQLQKVIGSPKKELTDYLKSPDYDSHVSFIENFHADFNKIVDAYAGKGNKVYVFIDDLDRCEVPKSADLMQAINLMISNDPQLVFILGMDREKIAAGLAVKYKEVIPYLSSSKLGSEGQDSDTELRGIEYGYGFIEKFVQLPFLMPQPSQADFEIFLDKLSSAKPREASWWQPIWAKFSKPIQTCFKNLMKLEPSAGTSVVNMAQSQAQFQTLSEQKEDFVPSLERFQHIKLKTGSESDDIHNILMMVAPILDWNPRRLKRFLNLFRLRAYIADATGLFYEEGSLDRPATEAISLEQLGKFTAIGLQYPLLLIEITKNNRLLTELQQHALQGSNTASAISVDSIKPWLNQPKLLELLRYGCDEQYTPEHLKDKINYLDYSLEAVDVNKLLQVSPRHPVDRVHLRSKTGVDYRKLRNLLKDRKWHEADEETYQVMLRAAGREKQGSLDIHAIKKFPCPDLQTIDQLWVTASRGRFGFSVQKRIWQECGSPKEYNSVWTQFGERVGWSVKGKSVKIDEVAFDTSAPDGHLPLLLAFLREEDWGGKGGVAWGKALFSRTESCQL